jgi:hypothetical protein
MWTGLEALSFSDGSAEPITTGTPAPLSDGSVACWHFVSSAFQSDSAPAFSACRGLIKMRREPPDADFQHVSMIVVAVSLVSMSNAPQKHRKSND